MRILLVDDDIKLCTSLEFQLKKEGYEVDSCQDGEDGLWFIRQNAHDLILLDRMLPSLDGISLLKKIRSEGFFTPVIVLTALGEVHDRVRGLEEGADDYIVKPFAFEELLARIHSISRRPGKWETNRNITFGGSAYDPEQKILFTESTSCTLSKKEGELLEVLIKNPNQILPRAMLLTRVWGPVGDVEEGNLDNYIHFLRRRLKSVESTLSITTIRSVGYRLENKNVKKTTP